MENIFPLPEEEVEDLDAFPEQTQEDVEGLSWLGHLEKSFEYCGHSFVIRTLKADEELEAASLAKDYMETMGQAKAWTWANVSLAVVSVDGDPNFCPSAGPDRKAYARNRFKWMTSRWYWHIGDAILQQYLELAQRQLRAVDAVRDLSQRTRQPSSSDADSSTEQDASQQPIVELLEED